MRVSQHAGNDAKRSRPLDLFNSDHLDGVCIIRLTDCLLGKGFFVLTWLGFFFFYKKPHAAMSLLLFTSTLVSHLSFPPSIL